MLEEKEYPKVIGELEAFRNSIVKYFELRRKSRYDDPYSAVSDEVVRSLKSLRELINQQTSKIQYYFEQVQLTTVLQRETVANTK